MKRFSAVLSAALLLAVCTLTVAAAMRGAVVDVRGKPVAGAKVYVFKDGETAGEPWATLCADKRGTFGFAVPNEKCAWVFVAVAPGYGYSMCSWRAGDAGAVLVLHKAYTLKGRVIDENSMPIEGSKVTLDYWNGWGAALHQLHDLPGLLSVLTDKDGWFVIERLATPDDFKNLSFKFSVTKQGRAYVAMHPDKSELRTGPLICQPPGCVLEGTLSLPGGAGPAPEGTRLIIRVEPRWGWETQGPVVGKDGKFSFDQLPPGNATMVLGLEGSYRMSDGSLRAPKMRPWVLPAAQIDLKPGEPNRIDLRLTDGAVVTGTFTDPETGKPWPNARLEVNHAGRPEGMYVDECVTDDKGQFTARVAAGEVTIRVREVDAGKVNGEQPEVEFTVSDGEQKSGVVLRLSNLDVVRSAPDPAAQNPIPSGFELKPGTYQLAWDPKLYCGQTVQIASAFEEDDDAKALMKKLPKCVSERARYMAFRIDGPGNRGLIGAVADESTGAGKGYDTVYLDRNRNWDLTDDEPIFFTPTKNAWSERRTEWVEVASHQGRGRDRTDHPLPLRPILRMREDTCKYFYDWSDLDGEGRGWGPPAVLEMWLDRKGAWKGTVDTNRGKVECVVIDKDSNGVYNDLMTWNKDGTPKNGAGDTVFVDTNGYGKVSLDVDGHALPLNPCMRIAGALYSIKPSAVGDRLTIARYSGPLGRLSVRAAKVKGLRVEVGELMLTAPQGLFKIAADEPMPLRLPAGRYKLWTCDAVLRSHKGRDLPLRCARDSRVYIRPGEKCSLTIGGELSVAILPVGGTLHWMGGREALDVSVELGKDVFVTSIGNNDSGYLPTVKFFDAKGKLAGTAKAGYT